MNKRQENALKTRQKLIDTAEELLSKKGFNAVSVEDITNASGVAKGTFYVYFKHKEDITTEICRGYFKEIENNLNSMGNADIIEKISYYFSDFMVKVELYGINICREWIKGVIDPNESIEKNEKSKLQYDYEMLENILQKAILNKELKKDTPVELLTHIIITQLYGMMTCWCMSDGIFEPKEWTEKFCEVQIQRILKDYII